MTGQMTIGVLGAGTMGTGIAVVAARAGHRTILRDVSQEAADTGHERVLGFLDKSVRLGKLKSESRDQAADGFTATSQLVDLSDCDIVIEAIVEDTAVKAATFAELDDVCKAETLFHTNTSTLSVTAIAAGSRHPERVVGTHYCNPAPLMDLVEVVKGRRTSSEAHGRTVDFLRSVGKTTVTTVDSPGFIVNRFLIPFENSCIRALSAGAGTVESIDLAVRDGLRHPMGPFTLLDIVGLDIHRAVARSLYEQLREPRFAPPPLVDEMSAAGQLGRKTGQGFYSYDNSRLFGS